MVGTKTAISFPPHLAKIVTYTAFGALAGKLPLFGGLGFRFEAELADLRVSQARREVTAMRARQRTYLQSPSRRSR